MDRHVKLILHIANGRKSRILWLPWHGSHRRSSRVCRQVSRGGVGIDEGVGALAGLEVKVGVEVGTGGDAGAGVGAWNKVGTCRSSVWGRRHRLGNRGLRAVWTLLRGTRCSDLSSRTQ